MATASGFTSAYGFFTLDTSAIATYYDFSYTGPTTARYRAAALLTEDNRIRFNNIARFGKAQIALVGGGGGGASGVNFNTDQSGNVVIPFPPRDPQFGGGGGGGGAAFVFTQSQNNIGTDIPLNSDIQVVIGVGGAGGRNVSGTDSDTTFGNGGTNTLFGISSENFFLQCQGTLIQPPAINNYLKRQVIGGPPFAYGIGGAGGVNPQYWVTGGGPFVLGTGANGGNPAGLPNYYEVSGGQPSTWSFFGQTGYIDTGFVDIYAGMGGGGGAGSTNNFGDNVTAPSPFYGGGGKVGDVSFASQQVLYALGGDLSNQDPTGVTAVRVFDPVNNYAIAGFGGGGGGLADPSSSFAPYGFGGDGADGIAYIAVVAELPFIVNPYYSIINPLGVTYQVVTKTHFDGGQSTWYTSLIERDCSINILPDASGIDFDFMLVGAGGGGGGSTRQVSRVWSGGGGGGGGLMYGTIRPSGPGSLLPIGTTLDVSIGVLGIGGVGEDPGSDGGKTSIGHNFWTSGPSFYPSVLGGSGGTAFNSGGSGTAGSIEYNGPLSNILGGSGGNGGASGIGLLDNGSYIDTSGGMGSDSAYLNAGFRPGTAILPRFGPSISSGGGAGGSGVQVNGAYTLSAECFKNFGGGKAGEGNGGGPIPVVSGIYDASGEDVIYAVDYSSVLNRGEALYFGSGGGGAGISDSSNVDIKGGDSGPGLVVLNIETYEASVPTPDISLQSQYVVFARNQNTINQEISGAIVVCECGGIERFIAQVAATNVDNTITFKEEALGKTAYFMLVGGGGQGGGGQAASFDLSSNLSSYNGAGGGGGGILFGSAVIGTDLVIDTSYNISIDNTSYIGGFGFQKGTDGSGIVFASNHISGPAYVSGGTGGGSYSSIGIDGSAVLTGPLTPIVLGDGGDGGRSGTVASNRNGVAGLSATDISGGPGIWVVPNYGNVVGGGGGGGGGGDEAGGLGTGGSPGAGFGGSPGTGSSSPGLSADGGGALSQVTTTGGKGGAGGGGGGTGLTTDIVSATLGGDGGQPLFVVYFVVQELQPCPPVDPICGCAKQKPCPDPVDYKKLVTGGNDPRFNPAIAYALQIRGSLGRPGYQKVNYGNNPLNAFGSYSGAPGGSRAPPRNKFN